MSASDRRARVAVRLAAAFVLAGSAGALWLGGGGSLRVARAADAWAAGRSSPEGYVCPFRQSTGHPCLGCGGTEAFELASRGRVREAALANPLGAFAGLAAWALALASVIVLASGETAGLGRAALGLLALFPVAFVVNAVMWWASLPPGALVGR